MALQHGRWMCTKYQWEEHRNSVPCLNLTEVYTVCSGLNTICLVQGDTVRNLPRFPAHPALPMQLDINEKTLSSPSEWTKPIFGLADESAQGGPDPASICISVHRSGATQQGQRATCSSLLFCTAAGSSREVVVAGVCHRGR